MATSIPASILTHNATRHIRTTWIDECTSHHSRCPKYHAVDKESRPKRLIHVAMDGERPTARLVNTASISDDLQYLALSHCWGGKKFITLQKSNLEDFERCLPLESHDFNKTFAQAISVTGLLGYTYLWIDSLCIIQDTDEHGTNEDWEDEIPRMGLIYKYAVVTLSSSGFAHGLDGMQSGSRWAIVPPRFTTTEGGDYFVISDDLLHVEYPLQSRGWALQESLLVGPATAKSSDSIKCTILMCLSLREPFTSGRPDSCGNAAA